MSNVRAATEYVLNPIATYGTRCSGETGCPNNDAFGGQRRHPYALGIFLSRSVLRFVDKQQVLIRFRHLPSQLKDQEGTVSQVAASLPAFLTRKTAIATLLPFQPVRHDISCFEALQQQPVQHRVHTPAARPPARNIVLHEAYYCRTYQVGECLRSNSFLMYAATSFSMLYSAGERVYAIRGDDGDSWHGNESRNSATRCKK